MKNVSFRRAFKRISAAVWGSHNQTDVKVGNVVWGSYQVMKGVVR